MKRARAALAALITCAATAWAQEPALRLEPLAERIAKLQAQIGQNVLAERSKRALPEAVREFDASLKSAAARATTADARDNYLLLRLLWQDLRPWTLKPATRDNAKRISDRVEEVAWVASKGVRMTIDPARKAGVGLAADATLVGTLAQRVARLHLLRHWGLRETSLKTTLDKGNEELRATLERLRKSPKNTPELETELEVATGQLQFLLQAAQELEGGRGSVRQMEFIAKSGDHILESMERAARLYEGLPP